MYILDKVFLTNADVSRAEAAPDNQGVGYVVTLILHSRGAKVWGDYTAAHLGTQVAFVVDGRVVSAPSIQGAILDGRAQLVGGSGGFPQQEAQQLADKLSSR